MELLIQKTQATPKGQKKTYSTIDDMPKAYHPRFVEAATCDTQVPSLPAAALLYDGGTCLL